MAAKIVPQDLLPTKETCINEIWAMNTIQYRSVFNNTEQISIATKSHLDEWQKEARKISEDLKILGVLKAEERIVHLCNHVYNLRLEDKSEFSNMYQVIGKMSDQKFKSDNYNTYLDMLYMFQYGIFRCQFNGWAQDASNEWMKTKKISYSDHTKDGTLRKKRGKGFVYKLLVSRASNTVSVRFQKLTERMFGEYIIVRDRKSKRIASCANTVQHTFHNNYHGYIVKFQQDAKSNGSSLSSEDETKICGYVKKALEKGIQIEDVFDILEKLSRNTYSGK